MVPRKTSQSGSTAPPSGSLTGQTGSSSAQCNSLIRQTGSPSRRSVSLATGQASSGGSAERVNEEMEISGDGVNEPPADVDMEDASHSHSDRDEMEQESDGDDDEIPQLPPVPRNFAPPQFGPPPAPLRRPQRVPQMQFVGFPPLGGGEVFGGEGQRLGGKEAAVIGDAQLIGEEAGEEIEGRGSIM